MKGSAVGIDSEVRFLRAVAERIGAERISELYLFAPMRQGGMETGIAVVAAAEELAAPRSPVDAEAPAERDVLEATEGNGVDAPGVDGAEQCDPTEPAAGGTDEPPPAAARRYTVYSARYRHTVKGPDRGKWDVDVVPEADAPLATVVAVVRGVQRRAGDPTEPQHMTSSALQAALADPTWTPRRG